MKIADAMTHSLQAISSNAMVKDAADVMKRFDTDVLAVQDGDVLAGLVTDHDIAVRLVAEGRDPLLTTIATIMTTNIVACLGEKTVEDIARMMDLTDARWAVIVNNENQAVSAISLADIAFHAAKQLEAIK